jgi:hypothetical protein
MCYNLLSSLLLYTTPLLHITQVYTVTDFPVPSRDVTNQTLPGRDNLIIPRQGEFG